MAQELRASQAFNARVRGLPGASNDRSATLNELGLLGAELLVALGFPAPARHQKLGKEQVHRDAKCAGGDES